MAKPNLGIPEGRIRRSRAGCRWAAAALALIALLVLLACGLAVFLSARTVPYSLPRVNIIEPQYGEELVTGRTVPVLSTARSSDRIMKQELWVDGLLVYVAIPSDPQGQKDFAATLLWVPKAGTHTLIARAVDGRGSMGDSMVVLVKVTDAGGKEQLQNSAQVAEEEDSLTSIGEKNNVSPDDMREANPDLPEQLEPGDVVNVPPGDNQEGNHTDQSGGAVQDPGADQIPNDLPVGPADPNPNLLQFGAPLLFWDTIVPWNDPRLRVPNAPKLKVDPGSNCSARLTWWDTSDNEKGFYIYRLVPGAARFERIEPFFRAHNGNVALTYTDQGIPGHVQYYVVAFNGAGEAASRTVSVNIGNQNCAQNGNGNPQLLEISGETLNTDNNQINNQIDQIYCYIALKGSRPFERFPQDQSEYIVRRRSGRWDIDQYRQVIRAPEGGQPLRVEAECWAARVTDEGGESFLLGRIDKLHPPAEWDGRELMTHAGSFTLGYRIRPWTMPEGGWQEVDTDWTMAAPHDFRQLVHVNQCIDHTPGDDAGARIGCALLDYPSQFVRIFEWDGNSPDIDGFRILENRSATGEAWTPIADLRKGERMWFGPQPYQRACSETRRYRVVAFIEEGNLTSPSSNEVSFSGADCRYLLRKVTLDTLSMSDLDDGCTMISPFYCRDDKRMETYGVIAFWTSDETTGEITNYQTISIGGGGLSTTEVGLQGALGPSPENLNPVGLNSESWKYWKDLPLCHVGMNEVTRYCEDRNDTNHNQMWFLSKPGDRLKGKISLMDYDSMSGDDLWCELNFDIPAPTNVDFGAPGGWGHGESANARTEYGRCITDITVEYSEETASHQVRPGEHVPSPASQRDADLEVTQVSRNSQGNLRFTLYNHGPDMVSDAPVTLSFNIYRTPTADAPTPPGDTAFTERIVAIVPPYSQTVLDTGLYLDEDYEKRVTVTVKTTDLWTDPDETNNERCFLFAPGSAQFPSRDRYACQR